MNTENYEQRGPWTLSNENDLAAGDNIHWDLKDMTYNGRKAYFRRFLPLDEAQITNLDDSNGIVVTINDAFETYIPPNSVEPITEGAIERLTVTNDGGTAIAAGSIKIELVKSAYDSDDAARDNARQGPVSAIVENYTGLRL